MSEDYQDQFEDVIVEVQDFSDAEIIRGLKEIVKKAQPINQVINDQMLVRFQLLDSSGNKLRDEELFPKAINIDGGEELMEQLVVSLCKYPDPYELYYDEEQVALQYAMLELTKKNTKHFSLLQWYLAGVESQSIEGEFFESIVDAWDGKDQFLLLGSFAISGGEEADYFFDAVSDESSPFFAWLQKAENQRKVTDIWAEVEKNTHSNNYIFEIDELDIENEELAIALEKSLEKSRENV